MSANEIKALVRASNNGSKIPALKLIEDAPALASIMSKLNSPQQDAQFDRDGNRTIRAPNRSGLADISHDTAQKSTDNENTLQLFPELEQGLRILINATMSPKDMNSTEINFSLPTDLKVSPLASKLMPIVEEALSKDFKLKVELPDILYRALAINGSDPWVVIPESAVDEMINDRKTVSTESIMACFGDGKTSQKNLGLLGNSNFSETTTPKKGPSFGFENFVDGSYIRREEITDARVMFKSPNSVNVKEKTIRESTGYTPVDSLIRVTDNIDMIKFPELIKIKREEEVNRRLGQRFAGSIYAGTDDLAEQFRVATEAIAAKKRQEAMAKGTGTESLHNQFGQHDINNPGAVYGSTDMNDIQLTQLLYKNNPNIRNVTRKVKTSNETVRENIGRPMIKRVSAECVIPVVRSGNVEEHVAYFFLLDGMGATLSKDSAGTAYEDFRRNQRGFQSNNNLPSYLMQRAAETFSTSCDQVTYQQMQKVAADIIETDLLARMRNGVFGDDVALVAPEIIYDIMLARMFREQQTQVLFVPAELVSYFCYKYRKNGTGKSLLEDSMTVNTLRAVLMFANVNRAVVNSMGRTEIELNVDENDPNKTKTLEIAKHEALKVRQSQALPATISPTDINHWLKTSGINFKIPKVRGLPDTSINITETASSYTKPDTDLMAELDKKAFNGIGIPPELLTNMDQVEFATNILSNNIRLNKFVLQIQDAFTPDVIKLCRTFCMNHGTVLSKVEKIIQENIKQLTEVKNPDEFIVEYSSQENFLVRLLAREFLSNFEFSFSRPDTVTLKNKLDALTEYAQGITTAVQHHLSADILSEATSGQITAEQIPLVQNSCISHFVREFMKKNSIMPELFEIAKVDADGKLVVGLGESISSHANSLTQFASRYLSRTIPVAAATERDMDTVTNGDPPGSAPSAMSGGGSSDLGSLDTSTDTSEDDTDTAGDDVLAGMPDMPTMDDM
jgi:hypothetical protein